MEDNKRINEDQLENVSGGAGNSSICFFVHKAKGGPMRTRGTGEWEAQCGSSCYGGNGGSGGGLATCICHNTAYCIDRWHIVTENGSPITRERHPTWYG